MVIIIIKERDTKIMKKILFFITIVIIFACIGILIYDQKSNIKQISGTIQEIKDGYLILVDDNDQRYQLNAKNLTLENINVYDQVTIQYKQNYEAIKIVYQEQEELFPKEWNDQGIFKNFYSKAYKKLQSLSLEEKIGQLLLARVPEDQQLEDIQTYYLGGYILFGRDTKDKTKEELIQLTFSFQQASKIPMIIAVDEEGGKVVRISSNPNLRSTKFLSPQELFKEGGYDLIRNTTVEMSTLLDSLGINVNFAPVVDVSLNPDDFIYERSFGKDANETSKFVETVIQTSKNYPVTYTLKHFPGYGNNQDTHTGISIDNRSLENFRKNDFLPFQAGIKSGAEVIMVSHNIITQIEDKIPASLSRNIHTLLREELEFTGIIITDDLAMSAIQDYVIESPYVLGVEAGNDMMIVTDYRKAYQDILNAIQNGNLAEEQIDQAVFRVLAWKYKKGLL